MTRIGCAGAVLAAAVFVLSSIPARAQEFHARLSGFQETGGLPGGPVSGASPGPPVVQGTTPAETGAILSTGTGTLDLVLDKTAQTLKYTLTYTFPPTTTTSAGTNTTTVTQSHIHFGKEHVPGGIIIYFCVSGLTPPPAPADVPPACPVSAGAAVTVSGTLLPKDVTAKAAAQNILAGDFDGLVAALDSDTAYVNIHTAAFPGGEIRGQIHAVRHRRGPGGRGDGHDNGGDHDH